MASLCSALGMQTKQGPLTPSCVQSQVCSCRACPAELGRCPWCVLCVWGAKSSVWHTWAPQSMGAQGSDPLPAPARPFPKPQAHSAPGAKPCWGCGHTRGIPNRTGGCSGHAVPLASSPRLYHQLPGGCDIGACTGRPSAGRPNKLNFSSN